jgi:hypothetical protein
MPRKHDPDRRFPIIYASVTHGLSVHRLLASRNKNKLQGNSVWLFKHGVRVHLNGGSFKLVACVGRKPVVQQSRAWYAVRHHGLLQVVERYSLIGLARPTTGGQEEAPIRPPGHPARLEDLRA